MKCRNNTKNLNSRTFKTKNGRLTMQFKCAHCGIKKSKLVNKREDKTFIVELKHR